MDKPVEIKDIEDGLVDFCHFGICCGSWGVMNTLNKGTRTKQNPYGVDPLPRERRGNLQLFQMMRIINTLIRCGKHWSVENPEQSMLFATEEFKELFGYLWLR